MNALVVGGNSGVGLSIVHNLLQKNYEKIYVVGKDDILLNDIEPQYVDAFKEKVVFFKTNFVNMDFSVFDGINDINALFITVGFGRAALFEKLTDPEIDNNIKVNLNAIIRIIKKYYGKINSKEDFYTSIMVSICGRIASPFFSVYSATKGGLRFFIESLNSELEANNIQNRILEVSPGSIQGTNFNGKGTKIEMLKSLAEEIVSKTFNRETLFIPQYDEVYKRVIANYENDPRQFALSSYKYKLDSGRISDKPQVVVGFLSGTFDLFHVGHLNLLRRAKEQCDYLIVSVHDSGAWKGKETFIPYEERKAIVAAIKWVDLVVEDFLEDSDAWDKYHYDLLFVGSDYKGTERFNRYEELLKGKAKIVYFPYTQGTSSTQLRERLKKK